MAAVALLAAALGIAGCAPVRTTPDDVPLETGNATVDSKVYGDLIRKMLNDGQYYAALAHIQQQRLNRGNSDQLSYFEAEAQRHLGQTAAADALYRSLLQTRYAADAYHGLGLLHADDNLAGAIADLQQASQRAPTDADMRNDLGYALLRAGRYPEALQEISTAVELAPRSERARNNLLLLLIVQGDEAGVRRIVQDENVSAETVTRLRRQAQGLRASRGLSGGVR